MITALSLTVGDQLYAAEIGSDVGRDGMYVEISDRPRAEGWTRILEVFYSDVTHKMVVNSFAQAIPLEVFEWAFEIAHERLPPKSDTAVKSS